MKSKPLLPLALRCLNGLRDQVIIVQHLTAEGVLDAFAHQVRLLRGRFGTYEPIDFLAPLLGYAMSGERTLADFFERVAPARNSIHGSLWAQRSSSSRLT